MFLIKDLIKADIHLGRPINKWNPRTSYYLFAIKDEIHIIDLEQSIIMLRRAMNFIKKICSRRGAILYIPHVPESKKGVLAEVLTHIPKKNYFSGLSTTREVGKHSNIKGLEKRTTIRLDKNNEENHNSEIGNITDLSLAQKRNWVIRLKKNYNASFSDKSHKNIEKQGHPSSTKKQNWKKLFKDNANLNFVFKKSSILKQTTNVRGENKNLGLQAVGTSYEQDYSSLYFNLLQKLNHNPLVSPSQMNPKTSLRQDPKFRATLPMTGKMKYNEFGRVNSKDINKGLGLKKRKINFEGSFWLREQTELPFIPQALFVANLTVNNILIKEATKLQIPVIGVLNNDSNPLGIQYPIPGNNESSKALYLYLKFLIKALSQGKKFESKRINSKR